MKGNMSVWRKDILIHGERINIMFGHIMLNLKAHIPIRKSNCNTWKRICKVMRAYFIWE